MLRKWIDSSPIQERLFNRRKILNNGCWEWLGASVPKGYGIISVGRKLTYVHRVSFRLFKPTEFKEELYVLHKCNNPRCFNPEHLYAGTAKDNWRDAIKDGIKMGSGGTGSTPIRREKKNVAL